MIQSPFVSTITVGSIGVIYSHKIYVLKEVINTFVVVTKITHTPTGRMTLPLFPLSCSYAALPFVTHLIIIAPSIRA